MYVQDAAENQAPETVEEAVAAKGAPTPENSAEAPVSPAEAPVSAAEPSPAASFCAPEGVAEILQAGGPIILILAGLSLFSLAIIVVKISQFVWLNLSARRFVQVASDHVKSGDLPGALSILERRRSPVAKVMAAAVQGRLLGGDEEATREEVTRVAQSQLEGLEAGLPYLSLIATISPLLGLLGTVLGMIDAFQ